MLSCIFQHVMQITLLHIWVQKYDIRCFPSILALFLCLLSLSSDLGNFAKLNQNQNALVDLGGVPGVHPLRDQILPFLHTFLPRSTRIGGPRPPTQRVHDP